MNAKRSSGYNITRYVFLVPAVIVLLLTFSLSKAEVAKHTFKTIATAISHVAIVSNNEKQVNKPILINTSAKPGLVKAQVKTATTNADTIYAGKGKDGKKSFLFTSSSKKLDSIGYVINGATSTRAEVSAIDPDRIYSVDLISAKQAKEFIDDVSGKSDILFITTEDSETGKELKEKINKSFRNGAIARAYNMAYASKEGSADIAPASSTGTGTAMAYTINSSSDNITESTEETNGSKNVSVVNVTGVSPMVKAKAMTSVKNHVYVTAKPKADVMLNYATTIPETDVKLNSDAAPEVVTVQGFNKAGTPEGKPRKIYITGAKSNNDQLTIDGEGQPLFIINGKEAKSIKNINAADIQSISVLKDGTAEKKYGDKGKNGVIEITTKKK